MTKSTAELIEFLCNREHPDLQAVQPERVQALLAMSVPTPGRCDVPSGHITSRGRPIGPDEQKVILRNAAAFSDELRSKPPETIESLYQQAKRDDWESDKLTVERAAAVIAAKIFPNDGYDWTVEQRKECEGDYRAYIQKLVLTGAVPYINPHTKKIFDHSRLSKDRFPLDGLLTVGDLYRCLMTFHAGKGYFPSPSARVSKAPPPINPLSGNGLVYQGSQTLAPPCWEHWEKMREVELWEAVALSLNYEPADLPTYFGAHDKFGDDPFRICPPSFLERLKIANSNGGVSFPLKLVHTLKPRCLVDISVFGTWAATLWTQVPDAFRSREDEPVSKARVPIATVANVNRAIRVHPQGGDSLTPVIWTICYDLEDAGTRISPRTVMAELKALASAAMKPHPLLGSVAGGVVYEYEKGLEEELTSERLRKRIGEWKKAK